MDGRFTVNLSALVFNNNCMYVLPIRQTNPSIKEVISDLEELQSRMLCFKNCILYGTGLCCHDSDNYRDQVLFGGS